MKSHFKFSKRQRNGIFLLASLIIIFQVLYFYTEYPNPKVSYDDDSILIFQQKIDSLKQVAQQNSLPKFYPFNPNFITDYKGYTLGMSNEEIDRLLEYRKRGNWINSVQDFQRVTKVSDSLLNKISPYFKFPGWVDQTNTKVNINTKSIIFNQKIDLNTATRSQLMEINGIGEKLSQRIISFRNKFKGGFLSDYELNLIYGLTPEVIERIKNKYTVKTPRPIQKVLLNSSTVEELVTIPYIDYELAYEIVDQRTLRDGFENYEELTKVKDFPIDKFDIIKLYLSLN